MHVIQVKYTQVCRQARVGRSSGNVCARGDRPEAEPLPDDPEYKLEISAMDALTVGSH